jgi:hypothetical protein
MAGMGEVPERVHKLFNNEKSIPQNGKLMVKMWAFGKPYQVTIDDRLPYYSASSSRLKYGKMSEAKSWWAAYAEKASAKFFGNYGALSGRGWLESGISVLTGIPSKTYRFRSETE